MPQEVYTQYEERLKEQSVGHCLTEVKVGGSQETDKGAVIRAFSSTWYLPRFESREWDNLGRVSIRIKDIGERKNSLLDSSVQCRTSGCVLFPAGI